MKVFLSHRSTDDPSLSRLRTALQANGIETVDAGAGVVPAGRQSASVEDQLRSTDATVFFVSPEGQHDAALQQEWRMALEQSWSEPTKPLIPLVVGDAELPAFLRSQEALRVSPGQNADEVAHSLVDVLKRATEGSVINESPHGFGDANAKQHRLDEISQAITSLAPSSDDLVRQLDALQEQCSELERTDPQSLALASARIQLSVLLKTLGRPSDSLEQLQRAITILQGHPDAEKRLARTRTNAARLLTELGVAAQHVVHAAAF